MRIQTLSLFPEQIEAFASTSILCRAIDQELLSVEAIQIRNYAVSDYGKVDDRVYGGGTGMLLMADPVYRAWETAQAKADHQACTYYMSPKGTKLTQEKTQELALLPEIILICGHYEGIDERVLDRIVDEEISIGDYVLTGGELAAAVLIDCVSRLIPGVLPDEEAASGIDRKRSLGASAFCDLPPGAEIQSRMSCFQAMPRELRLATCRLAS